MCGIVCAFNIKDNKETLEAEKPKPLKPLTKDAKRITPQKKIKSKKLRFIDSKYSIKAFITNYYILHKTN